MRNATHVTARRVARPPIGPTPAPAAPPGARWFALRVYSQREFRVAEALCGAGFEEFCPSRTVETRWTDRTKLSTHPLFTGYLFARFDDADAPRVRETRGVITILSIDQKPVSIPDSVIADLRHAVSAVKVEPCAYVAGSAVTVARGPFAGRTGVVTRVKNATILSIPVEILGRSVSVEIDAADVEKK